MSHDADATPFIRELATVPRQEASAELVADGQDVPSAGSTEGRVSSSKEQRIVSATTELSLSLTDSSGSTLAQASPVTPEGATGLDG